MKYAINQLDGLYRGQFDGAIKYGKIPLTKDQMYQIAMQADMNDLLPAFSAGPLTISTNSDQKQKNEFEKEIMKINKTLDKEKIEKHIKYEGFLGGKECSAYVKYNKNTQNLISSHSTHNLYTLMNRIYKHFDFNIKFNNEKINSYRFSSRPGDLNSKDDYYTLSNNMVIMETSLHIWDLSIYKNLKIETVPKWIRINIANKLANSNLQWIELFFKHNSGTHNNQWLIVDYKKFEDYLLKDQRSNYFNEKSIKENSSDLYSFGIKSKDFVENLSFLNENNHSMKMFQRRKIFDILHLIEQIPVLDRAYFKDFSEELIREGYIASYNAPYFDEVINLAGYKINNKTDYFTANRNILFKKFSKNIETIEDVKILMRFHDEKDICDTIAPRCDLVQDRPFGAIDAKITDLNLLKEMKSNILYGPPHIKGVSEPFNFTLKYNNFSHLGIPEYFDFDWIEV